jgi:hypothetical protein
MRRDNAEILKMFQFELRFLEDGGYGRSPRAPWRASYVFEDSPTCLNFDDAVRPHACADCRLMEFVPPQFRGESAPCRFIALTEVGETIDDFYQSRTQMELEEALAYWLRKQIEGMTKQLANASARGAPDDKAELPEAARNLRIRDNRRLLNI